MDVRRYGLHAYLGNLASTASYRTDSLMISAFADTASVGFYHLGNLLTFPMANFSRSIATTLFRDFAKKPRIPKEVNLVNFVWLTACVIGLVVMRDIIVGLLFGVFG